MTNEDYRCETCTFGQNGAVCALHGVEVERRKTTTDLVKVLQLTVDGLLHFKFIMLGIGALGTLILLGGYYFTSDTRIYLEKEDIRLERRIEQTSAQVSTLATNMAVAESRHFDLINRLDSLAKVIEASNKKNGPVN